MQSKLCKVRFLRIDSDRSDSTLVIGSLSGRFCQADTLSAQLQRISASRPWCFSLQMNILQSITFWFFFSYQAGCLTVKRAKNGKISYVSVDNFKDCVEVHYLLSFDTCNSVVSRAGFEPATH
ncbi:hypothetical protein [Roseobacter sp. OBYS 0001]|uniref:hypothetical protein n=1 Tax=Roseobacter sp. OBYS 0001 TaxID=882651 RepID=UPI001C815984|nr:hypothetical protein [Roseobacter sp. OBYS 0001]